MTDNRYHVKPCLPALSGCNLSVQKVLLNPWHPRRCHNNADSVRISGSGRTSFSHSLATGLLTNSCLANQTWADPSWLIIAAPSCPLLWFVLMSVNLWKTSRMPFRNMERQITRVYLQMINLQVFFSCRGSAFIIKLVWRWLLFNIFFSGFHMQQSAERLVNDFGNLSLNWWWRILCIRL